MGIYIKKSMLARKKKCDGSLPKCARRSLTCNNPDAPGGPRRNGNAAASEPASAVSSGPVSAGPTLSAWASGSNMHRMERERERERGVQSAAELNCVDGQPFLVDTHTGQRLMLRLAPRPSRKAVEAFSTPASVKLSPEFHRAERQAHCSPPSSTWNSPKTHIPQVDTCPSTGHIYPQTSALAHANLISPSCESVSTSDPVDMATGCVFSLPRGSQGLHHFPFPQPPPEVTALITAQSSGDVVSPVLARNSPLVPWKLPSEIGHFWLGLFKISEVKVIHACHTVRDLISLCRGSLFAR
jgi:hypothetical protein